MRSVHEGVKHTCEATLKLNPLISLINIYNLSYFRYYRCDIKTLSFLSPVLIILI